MADIRIVSRLIAGIHRDIDLQQNSLVVGSLKVGATSPTELTKAILNNLIALQNGTDFSDGTNSHTHDGRYFTETELGSTSGTSGAQRIGVKSTAANFIPSAADVESWLTGIDSALASAGSTDFSDSVFRISDNTTPSKKIAFEASGISTSTVRTITMPDANVNLGLIASAIQSSEKGAINGVATLDANQLVPITQIPPAALERLVIVADQTARFALTLSTVQNGDTVKQTDTGVMYYVKDDTNLDSATGYAVYSAGTASAVAWSGVTGTPTTLSGYGITDYASAAKAAAVADSIADGITDVAPSQNAVFDALALKQDASANLDEADTFFGSTDLTASEAEQLSDGSNADSLHYHSGINSSEVAGETFAASLFAVRYAKAADAGFVAGRVYKSDIDASAADNFYVIGLVNSAASIAGAIVVTKVGPITVTGHGFTVGAPLFLDASGAVTATAPSAANMAVVRVGFAKTANIIEVQIQVIGVM
jgi:hypothetical protein